MPQKTQFLRSVFNRRFTVIGGLILFIFIFYQTAWVSDDAYISFRTLDNFLNGHGLRWNIHERVQSFTHPLWFFLVTAFTAITRNVYLTVLALSLLLSATTYWLLATRVPRDAEWYHPLLVALLMGGSMAFMDYSSSGLENPLSHVLIVLFALTFVQHPPGRRRSLLLGLLGCGLMLNRLDLAVMIAFPLLHECLPKGRSKRMGWMAMGFLPLVAWEVFSLVYYGSLVPNTAYAKLGGNISRDHLTLGGLTYLLDSLTRDPLTLATMAAATVTVLLQPTSQRAALTASLIAYLAYIVYAGGDFMSGRFLSTPFVLAVFLLVDTRRLPQWAVAAGLLLAAAGTVSTSPRWAPGSPYPGPADILLKYQGLTDERAHYFKDYGLKHVLGQGRLSPAGPWEQDPATKAQWQSGEPVIFPAVGSRPYYAGPKALIIDPLALTDPFVARLPALPDGRVGHYDRKIPDDYPQSVARRSNQFQEPALARLYDDVIHATQDDDLWTRERWAAIWRLLTRRHDAAIADSRYAQEVAVHVTPLTRWQAADMNHTTGFVQGGSRLGRAQIDAPGFLTFGPYDVLSAGRYELVLRYRSAGTASDKVGQLEVFSANTGETSTTADLHGTNNEFTTVSAEFSLTRRFLQYDFRTIWYGQHDIEIDYLELRPQEKESGSN